MADRVVKFAWGLDLAHAGHGEAWERLTASWIDAHAPDADAPEVTARRILNWIYAWQRLDPSPAHAERLLASLAAQVRHVRENLAPAPQPPHARAVRAVRRRPRVPRARGPRRARPPAREPRRRLPPGRRPRRGLDALPLHRAALVRRRAGERPAGRCRPASRSASSAPAASPRTAAAPTARSPRSRTPTPATTRRCSRGDPDELDVSFPDGGYHVQRSGWDPGASFLIFDCGPLGDGGHGHYDLLSFEAHANGRPLVLDPGRGTYAGAAEAPLVPRHRRAQHRLRRRARPDALHARAPRGPVAHGRLLTAAGDVLEGEAHSPVYEAVHRRRITGRGRVGVEDDLRGEREHRYDLRFHLPPGEARVQGNTVLGPRRRADHRGRDAHPGARLDRAPLRRADRGAGRERRGDRPRRPLHHPLRPR